MRVPLILALGGSIAIVACSPEPRWQDRDPEPADFPVSKNARYAKAQLVEIQQVDRSIQVDLQYARYSVIAKQPLYRSNMPALLRPETAIRLRKANQLAKQYGYRILVWDAYRPPEVQVKLWHASGEDDRFVANPFSKPSQHSCGTAVDVTLVTSSGKPVAMPTEFDSFTPEAASRFQHPDPEVMKHKAILQRVMIKAGFLPLPSEWWHFTDRNFQKYPSPIPFESIQS